MKNGLHFPSHNTSIRTLQLLQYIWPPNLAKWWNTIRTPTRKVSSSLNYVVLRSRDILNISTCKRPMATKELPTIYSHDPSMRCSCEVTWEITYIKSLPAEDAWTPNQAAFWIKMKCSNCLSHMILWSRDQREVIWQFENLYFHCHTTYG